MTSPTQLAAISLISLGAVFASSTDSSAQQLRCIATQTLETTLQSEYNEVAQNVGIGNNGATYTQYANPETGTWTYTLSPQEGLSCITGSGTGYIDYSTDIPAADAGVTTQSLGVLGNGAIVHTYADESTGEWGVNIHRPGTENSDPFASGTDYTDEQKPATVSAPTLKPAP